MINLEKLLKSFQDTPKSVSKRNRRLEVINGKIKSRDLIPSEPLGANTTSENPFSLFENIELFRIVGPVTAIDAVEKLLDAEIAMASGNIPKYTPEEKIVLAKAVMGTTWIYFIACPENGLVKIGQAKNIEKRLSSLRTSSPVEIRLAAAVRFVPECEQWMHAAFRHLRVKGEWFRAEPELIEMMRTARDSGTRAALELLQSKYKVSLVNIMTTKLC